MGTIAGGYPHYFVTIGIEPGVDSDLEIWPVISTFPDEVMSRNEVRSLLNVPAGTRLELRCENGAYQRHLAPVFDGASNSPDVLSLRCSTSPHAVGHADVSYFPVARLFAGVDRLVIGVGYNSVHEALSYATMEQVAIDPSSVATTS